MHAPRITQAVRAHWQLDPDVTFLNHGSFGACPVPVAEEQRRIRDELERNPDHFFIREYEGRLHDARSAVATFIHADVDDIVLVQNATSGVNAVLRALTLAPGDELLVLDDAYNACRQAMNYVADRTGAAIVVVEGGFPPGSADDIVEQVIAAVTPRTRLVLLDHVASSTSVIYPVQRLVAALNERGVDTLIDGAHAPGMVAVDIAALGASYYTANCHKWLCAPRGSAFLHIRRDRQSTLHPLSISHGYDRAGGALHREFGWTGTFDPSGWLAIPTALRFVEELIDGGWAAVRAHNHDLAVCARDILLEELGPLAHTPEALTGSMVTLVLPPELGDFSGRPWIEDPLMNRLFTHHRIDAMITPVPGTTRRCIRLSAMLYNDEQDYRRVATALKHEVSSGRWSAA
jgi:isopenicillin-N epimerase